MLCKPELIHKSKSSLEDSARCLLTCPLNDVMSGGVLEQFHPKWSRRLAEACPTWMVAWAVALVARPAMPFARTGLAVIVASPCARTGKMCQAPYAR